MRSPDQDPAQSGSQASARLTRPRRPANAAASASGSRRDPVLRLVVRNRGVVGALVTAPMHRVTAPPAPAAHGHRCGALTHTPTDPSSTPAPRRARRRRLRYPTSPAPEGLEDRWSKAREERRAVPLRSHQRAAPRCTSIDTPATADGPGAPHVGPCSRTPTPTVSPGTSVCVRQRGLHPMGWDDNGCRRNAGCRTTSACVAIRRCPTTRTSFRLRSPVSSSYRSRVANPRSPCANS